MEATKPVFMKPIVKHIPVMYSGPGTIYSEGSVIVSLTTSGHHDHKFGNCSQCDYETKQLVEHHKNQEKLWWDQWYREQETLRRNKMQFLNNPAYHQLNEGNEGAFIDLTDDKTQQEYVQQQRMAGQEQINRYNKSMWYEQQLQMQLKQRQDEEYKKIDSISNIINNVNRKRMVPLEDEYRFQEPPSKRANYSVKKPSIFHSICDLAQSSYN